MPARRTVHIVADVSRVTFASVSAETIPLTVADRTGLSHRVVMRKTLRNVVHRDLAFGRSARPDEISDVHCNAGNRGPCDNGSRELLALDLLVGFGCDLRGATLPKPSEK
jgi:hypothetical protein